MDRRTAIWTAGTVLGGGLLYHLFGPSQSSPRKREDGIVGRVKEPEFGGDDGFRGWSPLSRVELVFIPGEMESSSSVHWEPYEGDQRLSADDVARMNATVTATDGEGRFSTELESGSYVVCVGDRTDDAIDLRNCKQMQLSAGERYVIEYRPPPPI